jgi:hypothetical protein
MYITQTQEWQCSTTAEHNRKQGIEKASKLF